MPYYRQAKTDAPAPVGEPYYNRQIATDGITADQTVVFIASPREIMLWHGREQTRLDDGLSHAVPALPTLPQPAADFGTASHYVHLSGGNPGLVAYTPSDEFGVEDRQLRCKPGKYLQKFYGAVLSAQQIIAWADEVKAARMAVHYATTPDECVRVYRSPHGPNTCMGGGPERWLADDHPAQVYGGGDVSVAYLGHIGGEQTSNDSVTARAVVNMAAKKYSRIYGIAAGELRVLLAAEGYTAHTDALEGARILSRPRPSGGYFIPYIDGMSKAVIASNEFLVVTNTVTSLAWLRVTNLEGWGILNPAI